MSQSPRYFGRWGVVVWGWGLAVLAVVVSGPGGACAQEADSDTPAPFDPPAYVAYRTETALEIDGTAAEVAWQRAEWTAPFANIRGEGHPTPRFETRVKMLWDEEYFYVLAELEEPDVWATRSERDTIVWQEDAFEVFIDPNGDTHSYYELQVNALETVRDLFLVRPFRDGGPSIGAWDIRGIEVSTDIEGTLNDPSDTDTGWTVELALPWNVLREAAAEERPPRAGEQWRFNFARPDWSLRVVDGAYEKEDDARWWSWASQGTVDMHKPERFGYVQFEEERVGRRTVSVTEPPNERVKWALRRLYYRQRDYQKAHGRYASDLSELNASNIAVDGVEFRPALQTTQSMYEITAPGAKGTTVHIRHDGKVWTTAD